jgi:hypothetical protein
MDIRFLSLDPSATSKSSAVHSGHSARKTTKVLTDKLLRLHHHVDVPGDRVALRSELALSVLCILIVGVAFSTLEIWISSDTHILDMGGTGMGVEYIS